MDRVWAGVVLLVIFFAGLCRVLSSKRTLLKTYEFAIEFQKQFHQYLESSGRNHEIYTWLIVKSPKMQNEMGHSGIMGALRLPFGQGTIANYAIILNAIPELPRMFAEQSYFRDATYAKMVDEAILRYLGRLQDVLHEAHSDLKNPLKWFREGTRIIVLLPVFLIKLFGLDNFPGIGWLSNSWLTKFITGVVALITFLSAVVTIIAGWCQTVSFVHGLASGVCSWFN